MLTFLASNEKFKTFRGKYLVSNYGRVYSLRYNKFLKLETNLGGYLKFNELIEGVGKTRKRKTWYVHITVVTLFGDCNGETKRRGLDIDHINGDKTNNSFYNLELVTHKENIRRFHRLANQRAEDIDAELFGVGG